MFALIIMYVCLVFEEFKDWVHSYKNAFGFLKISNILFFGYEYVHTSCFYQSVDDKNIFQCYTPMKQDFVDLGVSRSIHYP